MLISISSSYIFIILNPGPFFWDLKNQKNVNCREEDGKKHDVACDFGNKSLLSIWRMQSLEEIRLCSMMMVGLIATGRSRELF